MRLLGLTDLHANLYPYDYYRDCPDDSVGLARAASLIAKARSEAPNCLLFDNGDILQGTPLGDLAAETTATDPKAIHPVIAAMNTLDYAVATLGNHDFNYGLEVLERAYAQSRFPVVCMQCPQKRRLALVSAFDRDRARVRRRVRSAAVGSKWACSALRRRRSPNGTRLMFAGA